MKTKEQIIEDWLDETNRDIPSSDVASLCSEIIGFLASSKAKHFNHITFMSLFTELQLEHSSVEQAKALKALDYISSAKLHLLDMKFQLYETEHEDPIELETELISDAYKTGVLFNPETGEPVENFKEKVFPYFTRTQKLMSIHA